MPDANFRVRAVSESPARVAVKARNFTMIVDEPPNLGGDDMGANPVEYVLAALAGCLNVVGHLVANEMGFQIEKLEIDVYGPLNPARLFGKSYEDRAGYKEITAEMKVDTDADEETLKKWVEAVEDRCPVSDNLGNSTPVRVVAKELTKV
ncbi:MAG TPA: OsmC family peroxiredoxin [Mesotoga infera]|uniref:OsmC family peroxiredoxin n=1 Tax=Mesotoga infera TaxID=1236046 RepID=A0A7C1CV03_9BACT|nr:OsmC family peroxiredoxin [Mesotoga infera]